MSGQPPLGHLRGMYYDPEKRRYFPFNAKALQSGSTAAVSSAAAASAGHQALNAARLGGRNGVVQGTRGCEEPGRKRGRRGAGAGGSNGELWDAGKSEQAARRLRRTFGSRHSPLESRVQDRLKRSTLCGVTELCECHGEVITSIKSFPTGAICITTDHGKVITATGDRDVHDVHPHSVCSQQVMGVHYNVIRGTWLAVSNGSEPHIHFWRVDQQNPMHWVYETMTADLPNRDVWAMSSFDTITALAMPKAIHTAALAGERVILSRRKMPSDPLAVHSERTEIVFAGLRSSAVIMEDLRAKTNMPNIVASLPVGRAVTGVQRLKDSAVPWGLAVSGLSHQIMVFDIRFSSRPLLELKGHVNMYHTGLALTTSPDDTVLLAGGSDRRLRGWSTVTGELLTPPVTESRNHALTMAFRYPVQHVDVADDLTVRVAAAGDVLRFLPPGETARSRSRLKAS